MTLAKQSPDFILEVAERLEPEVRQAFLRAVEALKKAVPVNQIADLLDAGKLTEALSSLSDVPLPDLSEIRDAIASAAIRTSESIAVDFGMNFELVNERAVRWAQQHAGNMITNVNRETVKAVRDIIVRGQREGLNVRNQAQLIRSVVGLTDRDARAVDRFYTGLLEDVSERQARRQRDIMANRLLRRRAENIARTETIRASNMGTQLGWEAAQDEGFLPASSQKVWIATEDSRTCPICAVLDGAVVGMRDGFNVDRQAVSFTQDGSEFRVAETVPLKRPTTERTPPAHPSCRCTVGFAFDDVPASVEEARTQPTNAADIRDKADLQRWAKERNIELEIDASVSIEDAREVVQAVDDMLAKYPHLSGEWSDHPHPFNRNQRRGLAILQLGGVGEFGGAAFVKPARLARPRSRLGVTIFNRSDLARNAAGKNVTAESLRDVVIHEIGHVGHFSLGEFNKLSDPGSFSKVIRDARRKVWKEGRRVNRPQIMDDISHYAGSDDDTEFFAELFTVRNSPAVRANRSAESLARIDEFADLVNQAARELYDIDFDVT